MKASELSLFDPNKDNPGILFVVFAVLLKSRPLKSITILSFKTSPPHIHHKDFQSFEGEVGEGRGWEEGGVKG